eukprot:4956484-Karenia_brevis.AAC.1
MNHPITSVEPPPPVPQAFHGGARFRCPCCAFTTAAASGLSVYFTRMHAGQVIDEEEAVYIASLWHGTCPECGFLRLRR